MISFTLMVLSVLKIKFFTEFEKNDALFSMLHIKCLPKTYYQLFELITSMLSSNEGKQQQLFMFCQQDQVTLGSAWFVKVDELSVK